METAEHQKADGQRVSPRTNMFLTAVLQGAGFSSSVIIRNMSAQGALIEAPVFPPPGSEARMVRGSLAVACTVVWTKANRCGVKLASQVCVRDWLAPVGNRGQDQVDATVRLLKGGALPALSTPEPVPRIHQVQALSGAQLASDLRSAIHLIEKLGDELAGDHATVARHGASLQLIDIAIQTISKAANLLSEEGQTSQI